MKYMIDEVEETKPVVSQFDRTKADIDCIALVPMPTDVVDQIAKTISIDRATQCASELRHVGERDEESECLALSECDDVCCQTGEDGMSP